MTEPEPRAGGQRDDRDRDDHAHRRAAVPARAAPRAQRHVPSPASRVCRLPGGAVAAGPPVAAGGPGRAPTRRPLALLPSLVDDGAAVAAVAPGAAAPPFARPPATRSARRRRARGRGRRRRRSRAGRRWRRAAHHRAESDEAGAPPVPYRQPSTDPSTTVVPPAPPREYVQPPAPRRGAEVRPVLATGPDEARLVRRVPDAVQLAHRGALAGEAVGHRVGARELERAQAGDRSVEADRHRAGTGIDDDHRGAARPARRRRRARPVRCRAPPRSRARPSRAGRPRPRRVIR